MKMTMVSSFSFSSSRNFSRSPNRLSTWAIMPKNAAGPLPCVRLDVLFQVDVRGVRRRSSGGSRGTARPFRLRSFIHAIAESNQTVGAVALVALLDAVVEIAAVDQRPVELGRDCAAGPSRGGRRSPEIPYRSGDAGRYRRGATCRRCRSCSRPAPNTSGKRRQAGPQERPPGRDRGGAVAQRRQARSAVARASGCTSGRRGSR